MEECNYCSGGLIEDKKDREIPPTLRDYLTVSLMYVGIWQLICMMLTVGVYITGWFLSPVRE